MILRLMVAFAALVVPAAATAAADNVQPRQCRSIAGLETLWSKPSLRWVVVGELHGTNEMPAAFLDIVCNAAATKRPIVVAVERSETEQADIDAFMKSDGGKKARAALTRSHMWRTGAMQDGRSSGAYLKLLDQLRVLHRSGAVRNVVAFAPDMPKFDPVGYEAEMAKRLQAASATDETLVFAFVGNCHAMRIAMCGNKPAAAYLPSAETFTINVEATGGTAWNCGRGCGAHQVGGGGPKGAPRLEVLNDPKAPYDALLFLGGPVSASPPAVAEAKAAPRSLSYSPRMNASSA